MIRQAIKRNPDACIVAMGCFIEANKDYEHDGVNIIIGNTFCSQLNIGMLNLVLLASLPFCHIIVFHLARLALELLI